MHWLGRVLLPCVADLFLSKERDREGGVDGGREREREVA